MTVEELIAKLQEYDRFKIVQLVGPEDAGMRIVGMVTTQNYLIIDIAI